MHIKKLWPVYRDLIYSPWNQIFFLRLLFSWPYFNGRFSCNCMYFFYFLGCVYKANILVNTLRKRFLSLSPSFVKFLLNFLNNVDRNLETPSVESVSWFFSSRYSFTSFLTPSIINVLLLLVLASICWKPKRFSFVSILKLTDNILYLFLTTVRRYFSTENIFFAVFFT